MTEYLLDTNICIEFLNSRNKNIIEFFEQHNPEHLYLCAVVKAELLFGAEKSSKRVANLRLLKEFFSHFPSRDFDDDCSAVYGNIRHALEKMGTPIGANDLLIASIALSNGLTLVTKNHAEFSRVPALKIFDF